MAPVTWPETSPRTGRGGLAGGLGGVLGTPGRFAAFVAMSAVGTLAYTILLPYNYTQRFELANWNYLDIYHLAWAIMLGSGMGLVVSVQVYAMRRIVAVRAPSGAAGGLAFVTSLLPSFLCCTPIIPTLLAFVGVSGVGLYGTTGTLQHFFAIHQTEFLLASLVALVLTSWWGLHKVAGAACLSEAGCAMAEESAAHRARVGIPAVLEQEEAMK